MSKTLKELRELYPFADFYVYDSDGYEVKHEPHLYAKARKYNHKVYHYNEDGQEWEKEALYITLEEED